MSNPNTEIKRQNILAIVKEHYEPENQLKCLAQVWRHHVYPIYPMSLRNFRRYVSRNDILNELRLI